MEDNIHSENPEQDKNPIEGEVIEVCKLKEGLPPFGYRIKDKDGKIYFAHIGDVKGNEKLLYKVYEYGGAVKLEDRQKVTFRYNPKPRDLPAINVEVK